MRWTCFSAHANPPFHRGYHGNPRPAGKTPCPVYWPQVPGWDSLKHVAILAALEKEFAIRFKTLDIVRLKNVGDLQAAVDRKLAAK